MSVDFKWLQIFADGASGGDGGDGAGTGVTSADAGQAGVIADDAGQRLEALGVPKDKAEKYAKRMKKNQPAAEKPAETEAQQPAEQPQQKASMPSWDEFMQSPENKQRLESMMAARGRNATEARNAAEEQMAKLAPALELLSARYGKEAKDGQYDIDALIEAVTGDDCRYGERLRIRPRHVRQNDPGGAAPLHPRPDSSQITKRRKHERVYQRRRPTITRR